MFKDRFVAYDADAQEYETFGDFESARKWLMESCDVIGEVSDEMARGYSFIAKITHQTEYKITDMKENYADEDWPYSREYDYVGEIILKEL